MKLQLARLIKNICYAAGCASAVLSLALKSAPQTAQRWLPVRRHRPAGAGLPCQRDVLPLPALPPGAACQPRENGRLPVLQAPSAGYEMTARITIPPQVQALLRQLNAAGFSAYAVGGCVRDSLLGCAPQDWDICTSAAPEQTEACFAADRTVLTGARYGTVTVVRESVPYEITTFRAESGYADSRHPDRVGTFCASWHPIWRAAILRSTPWRPTQRAP